MKKSKILIIFLVFIILIVSMFISLKIGSIEITFKELIDGMFFGNNEGNIGIIKDLRMPRVIAGILIGANLSIAGVLLQAVIRNPLADPYVTGISSYSFPTGYLKCLISDVLYSFPHAQTSTPFWYSSFFRHSSAVKHS